MREAQLALRTNKPCLQSLVQLIVVIVIYLGLMHNEQIKITGLSQLVLRIGPGYILPGQTLWWICNEPFKLKHGKVSSFHWYP